ncbi:MAG: alpha-galactosidase [Oscillospiraceae bacterium]|nr:alpha-galactosidase [Oscillospiraceae bacterium]
MTKPTTMHYKSGDREVFRFVSGTTVLEEGVKNGCYAGLYWSASNHVHRENVLGHISSLDPAAFPVNSFQLEIDGQSLHNRWEFVENTQKTEENGHIVSITKLRHGLRPVEVDVCTRLDGTAFVARWLEIKNTGDKAAALSKVSPFCGVLWHNKFFVWDNIETSLSKHKNCETPFSVAYLDGYTQAEEFNLKWVDVSLPEYVFANHYRQIYGAPYYIARNNINGESFIIALAWSGGFETKFAYDRINKILSFETGPYGKAPLRVIEAGEKVISPAAHIGISHYGIDETAEEWRAHLRSSVIPQRKGKKRAYTIGARVVEEPGDWILREIDIAHEMGIEAFMVDAGWYGEPFSDWGKHRGDWFEGSFLPEGGLAKIREYCHKRDMMFGLWMEPEAITPESEIYKKHPEFKTEGDSWEMNLSNPEAAKYVTDCIKEVILDKKLDFFKTDYNMRPAEAYASLKGGYAENKTWRHFEALYGVYEEVRRQNPDIAMESCAGGGGRTDLGMMSRFDYCAESDFSQLPHTIRRLNAMTLFLPPEAIVYYHNHIQDAHQLADVETHLRVTLFALPIYVGFGAQNADRNSIYFEKTREYIALAKGFCRPVLEGGAAVYHHTPYIGMANPADFCALEYGAKDKSRGYCGIFKLDSGQAIYNLRLKGVDLGKNYEVTFKNSGAKVKLCGFEIANTGLNIELESINTSELILYENI